MPTYDFECEQCGRLDSGVFPISKMPDSVWCPCGSRAERIISRNVNEAFVKDRPYVFRKGECVQSFDKSKTRQQQHAGYERYFSDIDKRKRELKSSKHKHEIEWLGGMPGEMADSISLHEGDREAVVKDPVTWLKKTGTYRGD